MNVFKPNKIEAEDEFDLLCKMVYFVSCCRKLNGATKKILSEKMTYLLALYIKDGYSLKTKKKACDILGIKINAVNFMNSQLRTEGYLVMDKMNTNITYLSDLMSTLSSYYKNNEEGSHVFLLELEVEKENKPLKNG